MSQIPNMSLASNQLKKSSPENDSAEDLVAEDDVSGAGLNEEPISRGDTG